MMEVGDKNTWFTECLQSLYDEDESSGISRHLHLCQAKERAAKNVQSGYAEQGRGNPLYPCPVAYQ